MSHFFFLWPYSSFIDRLWAAERTSTDSRAAGTAALLISFCVLQTSRSHRLQRVMSSAWSLCCWLPGCSWALPSQCWSSRYAAGRTTPRMFTLHRTSQFPQKSPCPALIISSRSFSLQGRLTYQETGAAHQEKTRRWHPGKQSPSKPSCRHVDNRKSKAVSNSFKLTCFLTRKMENEVLPTNMFWS